MKKLILFTLLLMSLHSFSQSNRVKSFQIFRKARNAYYDNNFEKASSLFKQTIDVLGETNLRVQPFYILSLNESKDWINLEKEVPKFFELPNHTSDENYNKILEIKTKLETQLAEENSYYAEVIQLNTIADYKSFLYKYPNSKYADEVNKKKGVLEEEALWKESLSKDNLSSMENYLEKTKLKKYTSEAKEKISDWDNAAKTKAIALNTQESYYAYLTKFLNGKYRTVIRE